MPAAVKFASSGQVRAKAYLAQVVKKWAAEVSRAYSEPRILMASADLKSSRAMLRDTRDYWVGAKKADLQCGYLRKHGRGCANRELLASKIQCVLTVRRPRHLSFQGGPNVHQQAVPSRYEASPIFRRPPHCSTVNRVSQTLIVPS